MKILHYINNLGSGGAEKLLSDILPYMINHQHQVHIAISNNQKNFAKNEKILKNGNVRIINLRSHFYNPVQIIKIIMLLRKEKYDIVHAHLFPTQYWLAIASFFAPKTTKFIKTEHSVFNERKEYKILQPLEKFIYGRYDHIIGITNEVTTNLQDWLSRKKGFVTINNGVNLQEIHHAQQNIESSEYSFLKPENHNILMVGRFDGGFQKDQLSLVKAISQLGEKYHLFFAGEGQYEQEIKNEVIERNFTHRIHFLGIREDIYVLMHLMDLNVLSTNHEGLSGVALESMASKRPFIGSDVPGVQEIVPTPKHLFPPKDPVALKEKIESIFSDKDLAEQLIEEGVQHVKKYDISNMAVAYLELYTTALHLTMSDQYE